jgi:predicted transcriptional regulator
MAPSPFGLIRSVVTLPISVAKLLFGVLRVPSTSEPESVVTEERRGRGGKYDEALFAAVANEPGITVAKAAEQVGVAASGLYPVVRRLEAEGLIEKRGTGLHVK